MRFYFPFVFVSKVLISHLHTFRERRKILSGINDFELYGIYEFDK